MKLRNRITKPEYYTSGDLLKLPREVRRFYRDLWSIAEDSGCFENDSLEICCVLYPSPLDRDITPEKVNDWLKTLEEIGKLVLYQAQGKEYFWIKNFNKHQKLNDCYPSEIPLPEWITFEFYPSSKEGKVRGNGKYAIQENLLADCSRFTSSELAVHSEITLNQNQNQNKTRTTPQIPEEFSELASSLMDLINQVRALPGGSKLNPVKTINYLGQLIQERPEIKQLDLAGEFSKIYAWLLDNPKRSFSHSFLNNWLNRALENPRKEAKTNETPKPFYLTNSIN